MSRARSTLFATAAALALVAGCSDTADDAAPTSAPSTVTTTTPGPDSSPPPQTESSTPAPSTTAAPATGVTHRVAVIERRPHDATAFTQGLEFDGDELLESQGQYGQSALSRVDPADGTTRDRVDLDDDYFGEGLTVVGDEVIVLTWQEGTAFVFDVESFDEVDRHAYEGAGWGLCSLDDQTLAMSDGTATLTFRDPVDFAVTGALTVTFDGAPLDQINELECVDGTVWANVWKQDTIVAIDPATGTVVAMVDAAGLLGADEAASADVLNGIAHHAADDTWLLTGKYWPAMFEVTFEPVGD